MTELRFKKIYLIFTDVSPFEFNGVANADYYICSIKYNCLKQSSKSSYFFYATGYLFWSHVIATVKCRLRMLLKQKILLTEIAVLLYNNNNLENCLLLLF